MKTQEKKNYSAPALTVVSFVMERGFAGSDPISQSSSIKSLKESSFYSKENEDSFFQ